MGWSAMAYLALEPQAPAIGAGWFAWVGSGALSPEEHKRLSLRGATLTRLSDPLANATPEDIANTVATIEEHHPGGVVWLQDVWREPTS